MAKEKGKDNATEKNVLKKEHDSDKAAMSVATKTKCSKSHYLTSLLLLIAIGLSAAALWHSMCAQKSHKEESRFLVQQWANFKQKNAEF